MICGSCQEQTSQMVSRAQIALPTCSSAAELECHHRGQLVTAPPSLSSPLLSSLPQPSLLYKCQLTTTDTDGEQKHRTGKGREPPTGVRKQEDSTHTAQERILPDNIINSFILNFFFLHFNLFFFLLFLSYFFSAHAI